MTPLFDDLEGDEYGHGDVTTAQKRERCMFYAVAVDSGTTRGNEGKAEKKNRLVAQAMRLVVQIKGIHERFERLQREVGAFNGAVAMDNIPKMWLDKVVMVQRVQTNDLQRKDGDYVEHLCSKLQRIFLEVAEDVQRLEELKNKEEYRRELALHPRAADLLDWTGINVSQ